MELEGKVFCFSNVNLPLALPERCCKLLSLSDLCIGKAGEYFLALWQKNVLIVTFLKFVFISLPPFLGF